MEIKKYIEENEQRFLEELFQSDTHTEHKLTEKS